MVTKFDKLSIQRETYVDRIVDILQDQILSGRLVPGSKLSEVRLAKEFDVSRLPAREALHRLEDLGLVEKDLQGRRVKAFNVKEYRENYELRIIVEAYCAMQAAAIASEQDHNRLRLIIDEMKKCLSPKNQARLRKLNLKFHDTIVACSQNETLIAIYQLAVKKVRWANNFIFKLPDHTHYDYKEHRDIFNAFVSRDGEKVRMLMEKHSRGVLEMVLNRFEGRIEDNQAK
jgi:DNA-binding GntR family transcriptional regulator